MFPGCGCGNGFEEYAYVIRPDGTGVLRCIECQAEGDVIRAEKPGDFLR
jgi:hypothetical protein